jgi:hypothetical protein
MILTISQPDGKLEIFVPGSSAGARETVSFTQDVIDSNILDHPVGSKLPLKSDGPSIHRIEPEFRQFDSRPNFPKFDEMTKRDIPPISVHVTSFNDATILALSWPHQLMDAMGGKDLLTGWSAVLAGREEEVPVVVGAREDILKHPDITAENDEEFILEKSRITGAALFMFQLRFFWDYLWAGSREKRIIYLPKDSIQKIKAQAKEEIAANVTDVETAPWVTENDVIMAWITRAFASTESNSRSITALNYLNLRFRIPLLLQSTGSYLQNMCIGTFTFLSAPIARSSLGQIALENRRHTAEQGTDEQGRRVINRMIKEIEAGKTPHLFHGPTDTVYIIFNNVIKLEMIESVNFAPAVIGQGESSETRVNPLGSMVGYYNENLDQMFDVFNQIGMYGKDHAGNCWLGGSLLPRAWKAVEESLEKLKNE